MAKGGSDGGRGKGTVPRASSALWMASQTAREWASSELEQKMGALNNI